jgi:hypothetical protein
VTLPKAAIWQSLRSRCLESIPENSKYDSRRLATLADWSVHGSFRVDSASKKGFRIRAALVEFGGVLLGEVDHLLDAAAEHQANIYYQTRDLAWCSPGWLIVTYLLGSLLRNRPWPNAWRHHLVPAARIGEVVG